MFEITVPLYFAFTAGIVAAFNPCGAAMFPAYVGYQLDILGAEARTPIRSLVLAIVFRLGRRTIVAPINSTVTTGPANGNSGTMGGRPRSASRETVANTIAAFVYVVVLGVAAAAAFLTVGLVGLKVAEVIGDFELVDNLPWLLRFAMVVGALTAGAVTGLLVFSGRRLEMMEQLDKTIAALSSGIMLGLVATVGFVVVFGSVGLILAAGGRVVGKFLPFAGLGVGMLIAGAGLYLLVSKRKLAIMAASRVNLGQGKGLRQIFLFGIAYAIASLSCALPIFLAAIGVVSGQSLSAGAILEPIIGSISYGLGMGVVLVGATIGVVLFKDVVQRGLRAVFPYIEPIGNVAMILAGLYLVYYWAFGTGSELLALRVEELF